MSKITHLYKLKLFKNKLKCVYMYLFTFENASNVVVVVTCIQTCLGPESRKLTWVWLRRSSSRFGRGGRRGAQVKGIVEEVIDVVSEAFKRAEGATAGARAAAAAPPVRRAVHVSNTQAHQLLLLWTMYYMVNGKHWTRLAQSLLIVNGLDLYYFVSISHQQRCRLCCSIFESRFINQQ